MIDLTLLRILKVRDDFYKIRGKIPESALDSQTSVLLGDYGKYFDKFPDHTVINFEVFLPLFRAWHSGLKDDTRHALEVILHNARQDVDPDAKSHVMKSLLELKLSARVASLLNSFEEGELDNLHGKLSTSIQEFQNDANLHVQEYIDESIESILSEEEDGSGIKFRLNCLNESMRPMRGGDFGIVAGRPDKGKTTWIASECTFWAPQCDPDRNVLWLNNEGPGKRIIPRLYQAALGVSRSKLVELSNKGVLGAVYDKIVGRRDKIRIVDIHGADNYDVQQIIQKNNAQIVIYDMIDNIRGFGDAARTDLGLEKMYQWARETAVRNDATGIATSQISAEGNNMQFPGQSMLKDSKTGKQGACDFIIMLGSLDDPGYANTRWIGVPKNKLRKESGPGDPRATVQYEPIRARYTDEPMTMEGDK